MRRAAKIDDNQSAIVKELRARGCSVLSLAAVGAGCPDLLVAAPAKNHYFMLEVKDGDKPPSARKLTEHQQRFHAMWKGPIHVVTSVDESVAVIFS